MLCNDCLFSYQDESTGGIKVCLNVSMLTDEQYSDYINDRPMKKCDGYTKEGGD